MPLPWEKEIVFLRSIDILRWISQEADAVTYADVVSRFYPESKHPEDKKKQNRDAGERLRRLAKWGMIDKVDWDDDRGSSARGRVGTKVNRKFQWTIGRHPSIYVITEKGLKYLKSRTD